MICMKKNLLKELITVLDLQSQLGQNLSCWTKQLLSEKSRSHFAQLLQSCNSWLCLLSNVENWYLPLHSGAKNPPLLKILLGFQHRPFSTSFCASFHTDFLGKVRLPSTQISITYMGATMSITSVTGHKHPLFIILTLNSRWMNKSRTMY